MNGFDKPYWPPLLLLAWVRTGSEDIVNEMGQRLEDPGSYHASTHRPLFDTKWTAPNRPHQPAKIEITNTRDHPDDVLGEATAETPNEITLDLYITYLTEIMPRLNFADADAKIINALQTGGLSMDGKARSSGDREPIPDIQWRDLRLDYQTGGTAPELWTDLTCSRIEILNVWPLSSDDAHQTRLEPVVPEEPGAGLPEEAPPPLKADIERLYENRVALSRIEKNKRPTIAEDEAWRKNHRISRTRIRELRNSHRLEDEGKGGAPSQK